MWTFFSFFSLALMEMEVDGLGAEWMSWRNFIGLFAFESVNTGYLLFLNKLECFNFKHLTLNLGKFFLKLI